MIGQTIEDLRIGNHAEMQRRITPETVREFVRATGDDNPIHSDPNFAATTRFGRIIAPGILTGGLISAVIGTQLPGPGTIYLSQSFRFHRPVLLGDTITARVEVAEVLADRNRLRLATSCANQQGEVVLDGEAWVMPSRTRIEYRPAVAGSVLPGAFSAFAGPTLAVEVMSLWMAGGLALAHHALQAFQLGASAPAAADPSPIRP
jgi:acyl dehydratase